MPKKKILKKKLKVATAELEKTRRELEYTDQAKQRAQERALSEISHSTVALGLVNALSAEVDRLDPNHASVDPFVIDWDALGKVLSAAQSCPQGAES